MISREIEQMFLDNAMKIAEKNNTTIDYVFEKLKDKFEHCLMNWQTFTILDWKIINMII